MRDGVQRRSGWLGPLSFVIIMLALTVLFVRLGLWQLERLEEKETLIAAVETRLHQPPMPFPSLEQWSEIDPETLDYRPVALTGTFDHQKTVLVFTNLTDAKGRYGRAGYWVMAPLTTQDGGVVWINRGFVPDNLASSFGEGGAGPQGLVSLEGALRKPEMTNPFTPEPDVAAHREWVRDPIRLSDVVQLADIPVAPVTVDLPAGEFGDLPQGGETQVTFTNRHIEYAGTWFIFAAITPIMLGFWLWRQRRERNLAQTDEQE